MILIALGANIPGPAGEPLQTLEAAITAMKQCGIVIVRRSHWYRTSPVPASDQPDFINCVVSVETILTADDLMACLHDIEYELGRTRQDRWEARAIDLDLLAYHELVTLEKVKKGAQGLLLPHPRLQERRFVLEPLAEIAPDWPHPTLNKSAQQLLAALKSTDRCEIMAPRST